MQPNAVPDGKVCMGIGMRHVVWTSAALALGAFLYVVTLEPMDEQHNPRAGALDQRPSSEQIVSQIRRSLSNGQLDSARVEALELFGLDPNSVRSAFYCGIVERASGNNSTARGYWRMIINLIERRHDGQVGYAPHLYFYAWAQLEGGDADTGRQLFGQLADQYEQGTKDGDDRWGGLGAMDHYNLACYRTLAGATERAMEHWALAVELGYGRGDVHGWWTADPDLEALHANEEFWRIGADIYPEGRRQERGVRPDLVDEPEPAIADG